MRLSKMSAINAFFGGEIAICNSSVSLMDISDEAIYPSVRFEHGQIAMETDFRVTMLSHKSVVCEVRDAVEK